MIQVSIHSDQLRQQPYKSKKDGSQQMLHLQTIYVHTFDRNGQPNPYPEKVELFAERDQVGNPVALPVGKYVLHPSSIYVDQNGRLSVAPKLVPAKG